jgi:hypothetical protein
LAQQSEEFDRIMTGSNLYVDRAGHVHHLDNTKTQRIAPDGRIMGTSGAPPGPEWRQLREVPPQ